MQYSASTSWKLGQRNPKERKPTDLFRFLDHLSPICSDARGNLQTWELPDGSPRKTVHRVGTDLFDYLSPKEGLNNETTDLERKLTSIEHGSLEWIRLLFQIRFCSLPGGNKILEDHWQ